MTLLLGHRGDPANHAENSVASFLAALRCGADGVELDVQVSADGEPFVIHDATLDRTTAARGEVSAHTAAQLDSAGVPRLRDVLPLLRDHVTAVELKPPCAVAPLLAAAVLDLVAPGQRVVLFAFDADHLRAVRAETALLVAARPDHPRALLDSCGASALAAQWRCVDAALCEEVPVMAWTVDEEDDARRLVDMGAAALISNRPCALRGVVPRG